MIAVDTNLLVYAHREDSPYHTRALAVVDDLVASGASWAVPWPCVHEFLAVVTHPRIYTPPSPQGVALEAMRAITSLPQVHLLSETAEHLDVLTELLKRGDVAGPKVHDARIAAICLSHGIDELWSADRDFSWFPQQRVRNPLVA
ncbi:type II toxin-antitoxin system VapC family toxin [Miniimonas arenae]|uniref:Ribonuclease VapC n=1 Tax=Miniimonas arenae TaxID=676201 RepID=A0A5C5BBV3_9MICO|nr:MULTISPECIES: TA system VapC family ribonuclease toxin [Miniimonas]TNU73667.1 type II toxin-antitoxin system VapC family toxin [Miniimonas arenae]